MFLFNTFIFLPRGHIPWPLPAGYGTKKVVRDNEQPAATNPGEIGGMNSREQDAAEASNVYGKLHYSVCHNPWTNFH